MSAAVASLKAPFPYFGGKRKVADVVWQRIGDVDNYIEPFMGSAAVLLGRPHPPRIETANDADCYVANFWRATERDPEAVATHADGPVNETDLHSRHRWLVLSDAAAEFRHRMRTDPEFFDAKVAGWWCWGLCCWIGGGWCTARDNTVLSPGRLPFIGGTGGGTGVTSKSVPKTETSIPLNRMTDPSVDELGLNSRPQLADAFSRGRGVHGNDHAGTCAQRRAWLIAWFGQLRDRLRTVRVCCGDWSRVCDSFSVTTRLGTTGIFFDPPYSAEAGRDMSLYATESATVAHDVRAYCLDRGNDPLMRIVLCGYAGEGHEELESNGWEAMEWKANGGYGNRSTKGRENAAKERLWFSPHCLKLARERTLFDALEAS